MKLEFHHINFVSENIEELDMFYQNIMQMETIPPEKFPRTAATDDAGYDGKIKFVTEGNMQMHLAEADMTVANKHNQEINPVEKGHIAFRSSSSSAKHSHVDSAGAIKTALAMSTRYEGTGYTDRAIPRRSLCGGQSG